MRLFDPYALLKELQSKAQAAGEISIVSHISTPLERKVEALPKGRSRANEANSANHSSIPPEVLAQAGLTEAPQQPILHAEMAEALKCIADQKASEHGSGDKVDVAKGSTLSTFGVFTAIKEKKLFAFPPDVEEGLKSLRDDQPRGDYDQERWSRVFRDIMQFARSWANHPLGIGWSVEELFGVDPIQPMAQDDRAGLALRLEGFPVLRINREDADVGILGGPIQQILRSGASGRIPIWAVPPCTI